MITTGIFPDSFKISKITPLFKKGDISMLSNYRPISLLPTISKIFERILYNQLYDYFNSMCSLVVSVLDSPAVEPRSNPGSGSALLMSEKSQAVYYISSCHMLID